MASGSGDLPRSLYVHVPFCARRCSYCDFAVQPVRRPPVASWLDAIEAELALQRAERGWREPLRLDTLYVGGGTPSLLGTGAMAALATRLGRRAAWDPTALEWTCEANPESFSPELAADWYAAGVRRLSLGVQSFHPPALRWMGRLHGPEGPARAVLAAREAGIEDVSVDLIFGLPERLGRDWAADLERALELEPTHMSLYGLTAEPGAALGRWVRERGERLADEDRYADEYLLAHERLEAAGFLHYELSNFALPGRESRHNAVYWSGGAYAALGPGAHAFHPPLRRWNLREWDAYRKAVAAGKLPTQDEERLTPAVAELERVWLGLRTRGGLSLATAPAGAHDLAAGWVRQGLATLAEATVRLTPEGWLVLDHLAVEMEQALGSAVAVGA